MNNCCVVVADGRRARLFLLEEAKDLLSGSRLMERADLVNTNNAARGLDAPGKRSERNTSRQSGPMHPYGEKRLQHRVEVDRRFARNVAEQASAMVKGWKQGSLLLVAEPHMLGLMRDVLHGALKPGIEIKELARDYTHLAPSRLYRRLKL